MTVLLSIRPRFALPIFGGAKRFEYRRRIFRQPAQRVVVYASAPVSMVVGEFQVECLLFERLGVLWGRTAEYAGITEEQFYHYFRGLEKGYAIGVGETTLYPSPLSLRELYGVPAPRSFVYVSDRNQGADCTPAGLSM